MELDVRESLVGAMLLQLYDGALGVDGVTRQPFKQRFNKQVALLHDPAHRIGCTVFARP
ncbi:hypothetical protein D3C87_1801470 [compost metagenome]